MSTAVKHLVIATSALIDRGSGCEGIPTVKVEKARRPERFAPCSSYGNALDRRIIETDLRRCGGPKIRIVLVSPRSRDFHAFKPYTVLFVPNNGDLYLRIPVLYSSRPVIPVIVGVRI